MPTPPFLLIPDRYTHLSYVYFIRPLSPRKQQNGNKLHQFGRAPCRKCFRFAQKSRAFGAAKRERQTTIPPLTPAVNGGLLMGKVVHWSIPLTSSIFKVPLCVSENSLGNVHLTKHSNSFFCGNSAFAFNENDSF